MLSQLAVRRSAGFTILELLIAAALAAITFSVGIAGFVTINNRSELTAAMDQFTASLTDTQKRTSAGEKPPASVCTGSLLGYQVAFAANSGTYTVTAKCGLTSAYSESLLLPNGVVFTTSGCIEYGTVRGKIVLYSNQACSTSAVSPLAVTLKHSSNLSQTVSVTVAGVTNEGAIQ